MNDELMRRISDALDAEGGLDGDADLRALLAKDDEALRYAQDLVRVDAVLEGFGERVREPDWDALAARIEARLDDALDELAVDAPPQFADLERDAASTREPAVSQEVPVAPALAAASPASPAAERPPAPVVSLDSRRGSSVFVWLGGLAAAAAVGLGITFGVTMQGEPDAEMAAAPAMQEAPAAPIPAEAVGAWDDMGSAPAAEAAAEAELPAAAAAQPMARAARPAPRPQQVAPRAPMAPPRREARQASPTERSRGGGGSSVPTPSAVAPSAAAPPSRAQILAALQRAEPSVQPCLSGLGEVATVAMQVGADGSVVSVRVSPPYVGTEAACIVRALHGVRMPSSPTDYPVAHRFRPAPMAAGSLARPPPASRSRRAAPPPSAAPAQEADVVDAFSR